jgi:pyruvate formate lyase activating enzyme
MFLCLASPTTLRGSLHRLRAFIDTLYNVQRVEVLPYHRLGVYKYAELGLPYSLERCRPADA